MIRNLSAALPFASLTPFRMTGNASENARIDRVIYEGVTIAGTPLSVADVQRGGGEGQYVTNISVCEAGCADAIVPLGSGWTRAEVCGRAPQPFIAGKQLAPLTGPFNEPFCSGFPPLPPPPPPPPPPPAGFVRQPT